MAALFRCPLCGQLLQEQRDIQGNRVFYCPTEDKYFVYQRTATGVRLRERPPSAVMGALRPPTPQPTIFTPKRFDSGGHFSKQVKNFGNWIFILIGIIASAFINYWFAAPFVIFFFYSLFPSEWKLRLDAERQFAEMFPGIPMEDKHIEEYIDKHKDIFFLKSFLKIAVIISFAAAFYFGMGNMLWALISIFIGYFTLPSQIKEDKPETLFSAYLRPILGIFIAILFLLVFESGVLFLLSLAFFFYLPMEYKTEYKTVKGLPLPHIKSTGGAEKILFVIAMLAAAVVMYTNPTTFSWGWGLELRTALGITMGSIWLMSLFAGYSTPPQSRAYIGLIMIAITMIAYSSTFPQTVGTVIFGQWWPTIDSTISSVTKPLGDAFAQMQEGMGSAWLMVSNPTKYYEEEMKKQQTAANLKSGGTTKSIEVSEFEFLINDVPAQPLLASAVLENRGEFRATNIKVVLNPLQTKSKDRGILTPQTDVSHKLTTCSGTKISNDEKICEWKEPSYSGDMKQVSFVYGYDNQWGKIGGCVCYASDGTRKGYCLETSDDPTGCKYCKSVEGLDSSCKDIGGTFNYDYAGRTIVVGFNYSFDYIVNVSLDLQLIQSETLNDLLLKKQIKLQSVEAQWSGGPVRASIWTQKQPVRVNEDTLTVISIYNQGTGTVKKGAEYILTIPFIGTAEPNIKKISSGGLDCNDPLKKTGFYEMYCKLTNDLTKGNYAKYGFIFNYNIPKNIDKKSVIFIGNVNYHYENTYPKETQVKLTPPPQ